MSAGFGYDAGRQVDAGDYELDGEEAAASAIAIQDDTDTEGALDTAATTSANNNPAWSTAAPSLTIGYNGYTVTADGSGVDNLYNGDVNSGDLGISGSMGGVSFAATTSISKGDDNESYSLGYTMGDLTLSYVGTNNSDGPGENASKMSVSYKMDAMTVSYTAASTGESGSNINDDYDVSVSYIAGALTASIATDEDSVPKLSAPYDLGGGVNAFFVNRSGTDGAGADKDFQAVGINFKF